VDFRYCDFKQAVKFCDCTFYGEFDSGDDHGLSDDLPQEPGVQRLVFWGAASLGAFGARGTRCFRSTKFRSSEPLEDEVHGPNLQRRRSTLPAPRSPAASTARGPRFVAR
jgi:hypothetical protein